MNRLNQQLKTYIEKQIIPTYDKFDKGHDSNHAKEVVQRSIEYYDFLKDSSLNINMVFVVAAYHDIGNLIERKNHQIHSKNILLEDENLQTWFTKQEIEIMADACEDHSTGSGSEPRTIYGKIVSDADKDTDLNTMFYRAYEFLNKFKPHFTLEEKMEDIHRELTKRFGAGGSAKLYIQTDENLSFLEKMKQMVEDKQFFQKLFYEHAKLNNWV